MEFEINIQDFIDESEEQIKILNDSLLVLENNYENEEVIDEIFRAAHTLKGGAGLAGYATVAELTHHMENLFSEIREKKMVVTSTIVDVLFEGVDLLRVLFDEVNKGSTKTDISYVCKKLETLLANEKAVKNKANGKNKKGKMGKVGAEVLLKQDESAFDLGVQEKQKISQLLDKAFVFYSIKIEIDESCLAVSLFVFMVLNKLREIGEVIVTNPDESVFDEQDLFTLQILFASKESAAGIEMELKMPDVKNIVVEPFDGIQAIFDDDCSDKQDKSFDSEKLVVNEIAVMNTVADIKKPGEKKNISSLRVDSNRIDDILNLVGELVINKARYFQLSNDLIRQYGKDPQIVEVRETTLQLGRLANELQEAAMQLRMVAIDTVFGRFPRLVRDLSKRLDKQIQIEIIGKDTELDKSVVEEINDPLVHLVRNAVDHGIEMPEDRKNAGKSETGIVTLRAYHKGNSIVIEVEDDGKGINCDFIKKKALEKGIISEEEASVFSEREILNLVFAAGFSTADVVSDISGRGVGMDVVKRNIEKLNGTVTIDTKLGSGTVFSIQLPLTMAIIPTLLVIVAKTTYAVPLVSVIEIVSVTPKEISRLSGYEAINLRNKVVPILRLDEVFDIGSLTREKEMMDVVIVNHNNNHMGLVVDSLIGEQEIVIKSLDSEFVACPGISGASILGNGRVGLIIDVATLIDKLVINR